MKETYNVERRSVAHLVHWVHPGRLPPAWSESRRIHIPPHDDHSTCNCHLERLPQTFLQVHKGIVTTGLTVVGLQGLVAAHHVLPMPCNPLVKSRCLVDGQRQPITVQHFAHPIFHPHPQPKLARFAGHVHVDDVGASGGLGRVLGQSIRGIDILKHAPQLGV